MENKNIYILISRIALEFRLSLHNVCKLLGKPTDEKTRMEVYEIIKEIIGQDRSINDKYKYLFFYETLNEPENISKISYERALNYVKRYSKAKKEKNPENIKKVMEELNKTERDFINIKSKFGKENLTDEEFEILCKYRIKKVISRIGFCQYYTISRATLERKEIKLTDQYLIYKLKRLSDFFLDLEMNKIVNKRK